MAEKEIILQGEDGQVDELVLTTQDQASCNSLEDCVRMLFPQEGEKKPRLRFKGFEGEWKQYRLGDVGLFRSNGVDKKIYQGEAMINLLNYMDVYNFRKVTKSNCKDLMQVSASSRQIEECDIQAGDVFFTPTSETSEDIGHVMVIEEDLPNTCYSYHLMRYRPNKGVFYPTFPDYGFQTHFVREQMRIAAKGVQRFVLGKNDFESLLVYAPSLEEQEKIASFMRRLDDQMQYYKRQFEELKQLKSACMENMFPHQGDNVPSVRFNGFEGDWHEASLGELFTERIESNVNGEMLSVTMNNGIIKASENGRYDTSNSDKSHYKVVKVNDIAYNSMRMWQGASGCSSYEGIVSPAYTVVAPNEGIDSNFFAYLFKTPATIRKFRLHSQGLTSDTWNLKYPAFSKISVLYPKEKEEQQSIASFFRSLDAEIAAQLQQLERLKQMKQSCLGLLFPDNQSITPPLRFKGFSGEWKRVKLVEIANKFNYGINAAAKPYDGYNKYLRITDIDEDMRVFNKDNLTSPEANDVEAYLLQEGDIVLARTGASVGKSYFYDANDGRVVFAGFLIRVQLKDTVCPRFIFTCTQTENYYKYIRMVSQRSGQPGVNTGEYGDYSFLIPPTIEEQRCIANFFERLDKRIVLQSQQVEKLKQVKKACLNQFIA